MKVVLVSSSPRRRELLRRITGDFTVVPPKGQEEASSLPPVEAAKEAALKKLNSVSRDEGSIYIAADTVVEVEGRVLGKPKSRGEAVSMLRMLSGRWHSVHTGVCVSKGEVRLTEVCTTKVKFFPLSDAEINWYIDAYNPMDKAGAYGIQDGAEAFVERIEGSHSNVVGLPLGLTYRMMKNVGFVPTLTVPLKEIAKIVRSKNAGPFEVTFDVMFDDEKTYLRFKRGNFITKSDFARLYGYSEDEILVFEYYDQALALKITAKRKVPSGSIGDTDVYAAQMHVPLMNYPIPWKRYE